jgi:Sel1 repeat-containing protein
MKLRFSTVASLATLSVVATLLAFGQANGQSTPSATEVLIPDRTPIYAKLTKDLDANKARVDDPVKLEVLADVRDPVRGLLIPKGAELLARVSYVEAPKEKKERAVLAIAIVGAEWRGGSAKLHGLITGVSMPAAPTHQFRDDRREQRPVFDEKGRPVGWETVGTYGTSQVSVPYAAPRIIGGALVLVSSYRHLPAGTSFSIEHVAPKSESTRTFESYRDAALRGEPESQFQLGFLYFRGEGVTQDFVQAADWYRKAAEQGLSKAETNLAVMYAQGQGVPQDHVTAYMWFSLASAAEPDKNKDALRLLESMMTPTQIAEGKRRAEEWSKQHRPSH